MAEKVPRIFTDPYWLARAAAVPGRPRGGSGGALPPQPRKDRELGASILDRVLAMLINEAVDAVFLRVASVRDIDLAMMKGVNYPKGLLAWGDELGLDSVLRSMTELQHEYGEDRYRPSPLLRRLAGDRRRITA